MGELFAIASLCLFSLNTIITKAASAHLNISSGYLIIITINILFGVCLFIINILFRDHPFYWDSSAFLFFLLAGFFTTYLGRWLFFQTVVRLGPARASTFQVSNPVFIVIIAWIILGEILSITDLLAIVTILIGLFSVSNVPKPVSYQEISAGKDKIKSTFPWVIEWGEIVKAGSLLALLSSLSYAIGNIFRGAAIKDWNEPILGALLGAATGMICYLIFNSSVKDFIRQLKEAKSGGIYLYITSGVLMILAQICVTISMYYIPISIAVLITMSTPVLVSPLSYFLLNNQEQLTLRTVIGIILVLTGIITITLL